MRLPNYSDARRREDKDYKRIDFKFSEEFKDKYVGKTFFLKTYGCQMNEHDSENIEALLIELGFSKVDDYEDADLVLLNTCSIRENAHNKAFGMLGRLKHLKETKKDLIIGLCGCMAQEASVVDEIMKKYKYVNFVFGTHNLYKFPEMLYKKLTECKKIIDGDFEFLLGSEFELMRELYAKMKYQLLRPKCVVAYTRECFVYPPGNVRVTLDMDICGSNNVKEFLNPDLSFLQTYRNSVLEVKWDEYLPQIIRDCVQVKSRRTAAFSKYAAVRF